MCKRILMLSVAAFLLSLTSCSDKKDTRRPSKQQLIDDIDHFGIDTVATAPGDTLCSPEVDDVLRHYPELYNATRRGRRLYEGWAEQEQKAGLPTATETMAIADILNEVLFGSDNRNAPQARELQRTVDIIDSLYLQLIDRVTTTSDSKPQTDADMQKQKSETGRARKAWNDYTAHLRQMTPTLPADCRNRFEASIQYRMEKHQEALLQLIKKQP